MSDADGAEPGNHRAPTAPPAVSSTEPAVSSAGPAVPAVSNAGTAPKNPQSARGTVGPGTKIAGAAALITALTVVARIAGFGRTFVFLHTVGHENLGNIYNAANTIPNIVFELVAGGALASLVVPLLAGAVAAGDRERVNAVSSALLTWVLVLMVPLAILVALLAGPIAGLLPKVPPEHQQTAASMLRIFAPQLPLYGIGIVLTGILQAHHRFAWPVIAPLLSSVTVMASYLTYAAVDGARTDFAGLTRTGELTLSIGTTCGVVVLALCLLIPLRKLNLRLRPSLQFPGDTGRQAVRLGWAGAVTVGSQQLMTIVAIAVAVGLSDGLALYNAAQTVFLLPWAVLAVPVATAVYPSLSAAFSRRDEAAYRKDLSATARSVLLLAGLGVAALLALAVPIAYLTGAEPAAAGIAGFAPGLFGYALFALLSRALYARGATVAAAGSTAAGWIVGAGVALALSPVGNEVFTLGLANAVAMSVIGLLLVVAVRRHAGAEALGGLGRTTLVTLLATALAAPAGWGAVAGLGELLGDTPQAVLSIVQGILGGLAVLVVFVGVAYPLARRDLAPLARRLRRRSA
ncbi:MATE family efflux transporter [Actinoplanes sp. TRM 88003]|uniref:MATE family efflux transporter n=1 Tax=Paractinoplanes aksuensis TaxID=2939490 RepID=A0ABT1DKX1_9ACTN|nr:lipid II flippase MurJ [Actinoplanes aksuensis]MCO8271493.1 MATE family efflux transporter [Actinoplanes aksuensis]